MAELPLLVPALLTSIPAALCLTWIYRRRRTRSQQLRGEYSHLRYLRDSVRRKKAKKRLHALLSEGCAEDEEIDDVSGNNRSLLASADLQPKDQYTLDMYSPSEEGEDDDEEDDDEFDAFYEDETIVDRQNTTDSLSALKNALSSASPSPTDSPLAGAVAGQKRPRLQNRQFASTTPTMASVATPSLQDTADLYGVLYIHILEASLRSYAASFVTLTHGTSVFRTLTTGKSTHPLYAQKVRLIIRTREIGWPVVISVWAKRGKRRGGGIYCVGRVVLDVVKLVGDRVTVDLNGVVGQSQSQKKPKKGTNATSNNGGYIVRNTWYSLAEPPSQSMLFYPAPQAPFPAPNSLDDNSSLEQISDINISGLPMEKNTQSSLASAVHEQRHQTFSSTNGESIAFEEQPLLTRTHSLPTLPSTSKFTSFFKSFSKSTPSAARLHLESLFVPITSPRIGRLWYDLCSLFDVHDEGRINHDYLQQLLVCINNLTADQIERITNHCSSGSVLVDELVTLLRLFEVEQDKERKKAQKSRHLNDRLPAQEDTYTLYFKQCPICLQSLDTIVLGDLRESLVHVKFCLENINSFTENSSKTQRPEYAMGGFVSEQYAVKNWVSNMLTTSNDGGDFHSHSDKFWKYLSERAHFILVQDRKTGQLISEKIPFLLTLFFRFIYQSNIGRTAHSRLNFNLLQRMTDMIGRKYNSPNSKGQIMAFVKYYGIEMSDFELPIDGYPTFNDFFYRKLRTGARPICDPDDDKVIVSPADCRLTVFSSVSEATKIWIKGKTFSLSSLLVDQHLIEQWPDCSLAIARLAPEDYHRFHLPIGCTVGHSRYYEGGYASVNPLAIRSQKDVLTENKRVLTVLHTDSDDILYIAVGAAMVGSVVLTSAESSKCRKGDEHGYFAFGGSTVLVLFRRGSIHFDSDLLSNSSRSVETLIRMGDRIGRRTLTTTLSASSIAHQPPVESTVNPLNTASSITLQSQPDGPTLNELPAEELTAEEMGTMKKLISESEGMM